MAYEPHSTAKFEYDPIADEPFIALPGLPNFRLTPLREGDAEAQVKLYSIPSVGKWALRRPFPYGLSDAKWWIDFVLQKHAEELGPLTEAVKSGSDTGPIFTCPLALRYVPLESSVPETSDALDLTPGEYVGNMHFWPKDSAEGEEPQTTRPPGEQVWMAAWDVSPSLQGRGVGTTMLRAGLEAWVRWMGVGCVVAMTEVANNASRALAKKCGFKEVKRYMQTWPEEKGGGERELIWWEWTLEPLEKK